MTSRRTPQQSACLYPPTLLAIAELTQQLDIPRCAAATLHDRDDMVKFKAFITPAFNAAAFIPLPDEHPH